MKKLIALFAIIFFLIPFSVIGQDIDYCEGDFDCESDCDGTDAAVFKSDFGRSYLKNPCPSCLPLAPPPKTGQTNCYNDLGDFCRTNTY